MPDFPEIPARPNPFRCSAERHLWRHGLALAIYEKIGALTYGGKRNYSADTAQMANFLDSNPAFVRRTFAALDRMGWLIVEGKDGTYKSVRTGRARKTRLWISHDEWAKANPGKCKVVEQLVPWTVDADPFAGQMSAALDFKMRMYESLLKYARSTGRSDSEIVAALASNWQAAKERRARKDFNRVSVKSVFFDTIKGLKGAATAVRGATCR